MDIVAGVDGGGTRTRVALADTSGRLLGVGMSGPSNYGSTPLDKVQKHLSEAFKNAFYQAELSSNNIQSLFMGMAGVVSESDRNVIYKLVDELEIIDTPLVEVDHDIRISLAGGLAGKPGIALISGTGSSCYGRSEDGEDWMSGGWGHLLDDKGSAYDLARQALIALVRAKDGRGDETMLSDLMKEGLKIDDTSEIMWRLYFEGFSGKGVPMSKEEIASLAPLVIQAAEADDAVAKRIIDEGVNELVLMVQTVVNALDFQNNDIPIVISGGLVEQSKYYQNKLFRELRLRVTKSEIFKPKLTPLLGAVLLAVQLLDLENEEEIIENLISGKVSEFE